MNIPVLSSRQRTREAWTQERLTFERSVALGFALESSTASTYDSHLNSYLNFCRLHDRPVDPTPDTLSFFVVWLSHHIEPRSVDSYLSGIVSKLETYYPHARINRCSQLVACTLKGCKRKLSQPVTRKLPLSRDDIQRVLCTTTLNDTYNSNLFAAMLATGFETLQRLGELTWPDDKRLQSYRHVPMRHTLQMTANSASYLLPHQKNASLATGNLVVLRSLGSLGTDPLQVLHTYIASRDAHFPLRPELWLTQEGLIPTRRWFMRRLCVFFPNTSISGHSLRAGGATALAAWGVAPDLIQAAGRWSSDEFNKCSVLHGGSCSFLFICLGPYILGLSDVSFISLVLGQDLLI